MLSIQVIGATLRHRRSAPAVSLAAVCILAGGYANLRPATNGNVWFSSDASSRLAPVWPADPDTTVLVRLGFADGGHRKALTQALLTTAEPDAPVERSTLDAQTIATLMATGNQPNGVASGAAVDTAEYGLPKQSAVVEVTAGSSNSGTANSGPPNSGISTSTPASSTSLNPAGPLAPIIQIQLARYGQSIVRAELPIDLDTASPRNNRLLIGRMPSGVRFSKGTSAGPGLWQMPTTDFKGSEILVDAAAPQAFQLTLMLLDAEGTVVNGIDVAFSQIELATLPGVKSAATPYPAARATKPQPQSAPRAPAAPLATGTQLPRPAPVVEPSAVKRPSARNGTTTQQRIAPFSTQTQAATTAKRVDRASRADIRLAQVAAQPQPGPRVRQAAISPPPAATPTFWGGLTTSWAPVQALGWPQ